MKKRAYLTLLAAIFLFGEEPSAYKAGDLNSPNPYGLTSSEKKIVEQNKNIQNISTKLFDTAQSQAELRNEIDGIKSIMVGHSEKIRQFEQKIENDANSSLAMQNLEKKFDDNLKLQNENYDKIMSTLSALASLIDDTRETYISKEQLKAILGKNYKEVATSAKKSVTTPDKNSSLKAPTEEKPVATEKAEKETPKEQVSSKNAADIFKKAQQEFRDNKLQDAKATLEELKAKDPAYKKAVVEYYLGEIAYKNSAYKDALIHYQASVEVDEKASYIPIILFRTSVSLEKTGDKASAKKILSSLIKNYPDHYLVAPAKKRLAEIK